MNLNKQIQTKKYKKLVILSNYFKNQQKKM